jgi:hypothetical protein
MNATGREPVAWVLNLDAEDELARKLGHHTPTDAMTARVESLLQRLEALFAPGDTVLWPVRSDGPATRRDVLGRAWCPTPWALRRMAQAGVRVPTAPSLAVLRRVNHRRFAHALGQALPATGHAEDAAELEALLEQTAALEAVSGEVCWLLKRPWGYAGRGRRKLRPGPVSAADQAWIDASLRTGEGLQVEPFVARELDCALHGWLAADGECTLGAPTVQQLDGSGAWQGTTLAGPGELTRDELAALQAAARQTAQALQAAGYFGPFGLDAFRWRTPAGQARFQPRCELNARYSMGWAVGMGGAQKAL